MCDIVDLPEQISVLLVTIGRVLAVKVSDQIVNNLIKMWKLRRKKRFCKSGTSDWDNTTVFALPPHLALVCAKF